MPTNPLMARDGATDSRDEALRYMEATIGDVGPASSRERKEAYVDSVGDFVTLCERLGMRFARAPDYPDYYPEKPGGKVGRFNGFARTGIDQDFGRGNSLYDRYYGDPLVRPNPNLGPLEKGPFTAVQVVPGDLGTKGGLLTDADARVLREGGSPLRGLYAAGNTSASVMGRTYPGPGSTLGPAVIFGLRAARHMASRRI